MTLLRNGPEVGAAHTVEFEADEGPHVCLADPDQIAQVFWNLARNGLEAMPEGGVLEVRLRAPGGRGRAVGADQGRGMGTRRAAPALRAVPLAHAHGHRPRPRHRVPDRPRAPRRHHGAERPAEGTEVEVRLPLLPVPVTA